ncbi:MAG: hypothetical protein K2O37_05820, partial [Bacteroidales bacterium]|nr:hypothetical protein [Bacteroidales bacterium]
MKRMILHRFLHSLAIVVSLLGSAAGVSAWASEASETEISERVSELNRLFSKIYEADEETRWNACDSFTNAARQVMEDYADADFPFDKIRNINYFKADNGSFRMLNWGIPEASGTVSYKALLQVYRQSK